MQRFHFHVHDGTSFADEEGTLLEDERAARVEAVALAGAMLIEHRSAFWNDPVWRMNVTDGEGATLFTLKFSAEDCTDPRIAVLATVPPRTDAPAMGLFAGSQA